MKEKVTEIRQRTAKAAGAVGTSAKKAAYAAIGAPAVARKRIAANSDKWRKGVQKEFDTWVAAGERLTGEMRDGKMVEDLKDKVDLDQLQDRVERLRDQLEDVLAGWRASFMPEKSDAAAKKPAAKAPVTKKPAAKKPAVKKPAAKAPAAKKPAAKAPARKTATSTQS